MRRRYPQTKKSRNKPRSKPTTYINILLLIIFAYMAFLYNIKFNSIKIHTLEIYGTTNINTSSIITLFNEYTKNTNPFALPRNHKLIFNKEDFKKVISANNPQLKVTKIQKDKNIVKIYTQDKRHKFIVCDPNNNCFLADNNGKIFQEYPTYLGINNTFIITNKSLKKGDTLNTSKLNNINNLINALKQTELINPIKISKLGQSSYNIESIIYPNSNPIKTNIYIEQSEDYSKAIYKLKAFLLNENIQNELKKYPPKYLDARISNKIYYQTTNK